MAIRINLLAEEQELEDLRKRDPVKRAIQISVAILVCMLIWIGANFARSMAASNELKKHEDELAGVDGKSKAAVNNLKTANQMDAKYTSLQTMASERFLWAPILDSIYKSTLPEVEIMKMRVDQKYAITEKKAPNKNDPKDKGKPAQSKENVKLLIEARDFSKSGESSYDKFKDRLAADAYLKEKLAGGGAVRLGNVSDRVTDFQDPGKTFRNFSIEIEFPEKIRLP